MKALVTGNAGYIGSVLTEHLSSNGDDVVGFDHHTADTDDIRDRDRLRSVLRDQDIDIVYHLAAEADVWVEDWQRLLDTNVVGTVNVVAAAREAGIPVVFSSSVAASGEFNPYGRSKRVAEQAVGEHDGVTTLRFPNVVGRRAPRGQAHDMIKEGLDGEVEVWGNGDIRRSYVDVRDLCVTLREIGTGSFTVQSPAAIAAHTTTNLALGELIQTVVEEETGQSPALSVVDRSPPSPQLLTAGDLRLRNPRSLKQSVQSQVRAYLAE